MDYTVLVLANIYAENSTEYVGSDVVTAVVMKSSGIQYHVVCWKPTDISVEHVISIFRVEE
jgi:hypothetical protein